MTNSELNQWISNKINNIPNLSDLTIAEHFNPKNFQKKQISSGQYIPIFDGFKNTISREWNIQIAFPYTKVIPTHVHKYLEIEYVYQGGCHQTLQKQDFHMTKGDIMLLDVNEPHSYQIDSPDTVIMNILITNKFFNSEFLSTIEGSDMFSYYVSSIISQQNEHDQFVFFETHDNPHINELMQHILGEYVSHQDESNEIIENYLHILFLMMKREFLSVKTFNNIDQKSGLSIVYPFMNWLKFNYQNASLNSFSKSLGYHPDYIGHLIKNSTGRNFTTWVKVIRIKTAADLLIGNNQTITEIAHDVGFSNMTSFYKAFRDIYHQTPLQYKKKLS